MSTVLPLSAHPGVAARRPAVVTALAVTLALMTADPAHGAGCGAELALNGGCAEHINTVRVGSDGWLRLNVAGQVAWHPGSACRGLAVLQFPPGDAAAAPQTALALTAYAAGSAIAFQCAAPAGAGACLCNSMGIQGVATAPAARDGCGALDAAGCPAALATAADRDLTPYGGGGGTAFRQVCGSGQLAVGVNVRSGSTINQVQVICQTATLAVDQVSGRHYYSIGVTGAPVTTVVAGGGGGTAGSLVCPAGSFLDAVQVRSGSLIDQATFTCARIDFTGYPQQAQALSTDTASATYGGGGGTSRTAERCAEGEFLAGIYGRAGSLIDQLGPVCRGYRLTTH